jgi:hypothetical protein
MTKGTAESQIQDATQYQQVLREPNYDVKDDKIIITHRGHDKASSDIDRCVSSESTKTGDVVVNDRPVDFEIQGTHMFGCQAST